MVQKTDPFDGCYGDIVEICDRRYDMWICLKMMVLMGTPPKFHGWSLSSPWNSYKYCRLDFWANPNQARNYCRVAPWNFKGVLFACSQRSCWGKIWGWVMSVSMGWFTPNLLMVVPVFLQVIPPVSRWSSSQLLMLIYPIPSYPIQSNPCDPSPTIKKPDEEPQNE